LKAFFGDVEKLSGQVSFRSLDT
jgi:hypothetical protein